MSAALRILKDVFGYDAFRGNQAAIIDRVAGGGDALVLMPTGGGKSLCYQVPGLLREGLAVIVSPLIALMDDQVATLDELGVAAVALNSTLSAEEQRGIAERIRRGEIKFLYLAPERLVQPRMLDFLQRLPQLVFQSDSNWLLREHYDVYLWKCCEQGSVWMRDAEAAQGYNQKYELAVQNLLTANNYRAWGGAPLAVQSGGVV